MTFEHYILTRFSLSYFEGIAEANLNEDYLDSRFKLFETFCLPSVKNQSCQNFKWLILFDSQTPIKFKKRIEALRDDYPLIIPCFIDYKEEELKAHSREYESLNNDYEKTIKVIAGNTVAVENERPSRLILPHVIRRIIDGLSKSPDYYVTTRLDNDDAIHRDFVATIQAIVEKNYRRVLIDYVNTFKCILNEGIVYQYPLENGHFITLVEPSNGVFQSVLFWNHLYASIFVESVHFTQPPIQLELIHNNNFVNAFTELSITGLINGFVHFRKRDYGLTEVQISAKRFIVILGSLIKTKLNKEGSRKMAIKRYMWPFPKFKREVVVMVDGSGHGGLTDRLRNILSVYSVCKEHGMPFRIHYTYPCELSLLLCPHLYDWHINDSDVSYSVYDSKDVFLWVDKTEDSLGHRDWIEKRHKDTLHSIVTSKKRIQYHIHGNSYFAEGRYRSLFYELFEPSLVLRERLKIVSSGFPDSYEGVSLRFQNLLGDYNEYDSKPLSLSDRESLIKDCLEKIKELHDCGYFSTDSILVTSDSVSFLDEVRRLPYVHIIPGRSVHPDCTEEVGLEIAIKPFVDLFLLMNAGRITLLKTGKMYDSGFPRLAAELGDVSFNLISF